MFIHFIYFGTLLSGHINISATHLRISFVLRLYSYLIHWQWRQQIFSSELLYTKSCLQFYMKLVLQCINLKLIPKKVCMYNYVFALTPLTFMNMKWMRWKTSTELIYWESEWDSFKSVGTWAVHQTHWTWIKQLPCPLTLSWN